MVNKKRNTNKRGFSKTKVYTEYSFTKQLLSAGYHILLVNIYLPALYLVYFCLNLQYAIPQVTPENLYNANQPPFASDTWAILHLGNENVESLPMRENLYFFLQAFVLKAAPSEDRNKGQNQVQSQTKVKTTP